MSEWREVTLEGLIELHDQRRVPLSSAVRSTRQGVYPYYGAQGVIDYIDDYIFDGRYILIPEDGENLNSRKQPIAYFAEGRFWVNNHAHIATAREGIAIDRFVQSALEASDISGFITGAAQPKLSQANLLRIPLRAPPYADQIRISEILEAMDNLIQNSRRRIALLEQMAQAIYREWLVHFRYPGHENSQLVESSIGRIPAGWHVRRLPDEADVSFGFPLKSKGFGAEGEWPVIRIRDVPKGFTPTFTDEFPGDRYLVEDGDILIGMDGEFHMCRWSGGRALLNQRVTRVRPKKL